MDLEYLLYKRRFAGFYLQYISEYINSKLIHSPRYNCFEADVGEREECTGDGSCCSGYGCAGSPKNPPTDNDIVVLPDQLVAAIWKDIKYHHTPKPKNFPSFRTPRFDHLDITGQYVLWRIICLYIRENIQINDNGDTILKELYTYEPGYYNEWDVHLKLTEFTARVQRWTKSKLMAAQRIKIWIILRDIFPPELCQETIKYVIQNEPDYSELFVSISDLMHMEYPDKPRIEYSNVVEVVRMPANKVKAMSFIENRDVTFYTPLNKITIVGMIKGNEVHVVDGYHRLQLARKRREDVDVLIIQRK